MWFGKKNAPLPTCVITTSEVLELEVVTSYKYLGVWLDGTLSFSQHISKLQAKVKSRLGVLYRNRSSFNPAAKLTLIKMTILPMQDYRDVIYRSAGKDALEWLDVLYHSAIRFATNAPYRTDHCTHSILFCKLVISVYPLQNPLRPHSPLSEISTAALILHM